jgi:hypothetical protein
MMENNDNPPSDVEDEEVKIPPYKGNSVASSGSGKEESNAKTEAAATVLAATALPNNSDTYFNAMTENFDPVMSNPRPPGATPPNLNELIKEADPETIYLKMLNEGNLLDIMAEYSVQMQRKISNEWTT